MEGAISKQNITQHTFWISSKLITAALITTNEMSMHMYMIEIKVAATFSWNIFFLNTDTSGMLYPNCLLIYQPVECSLPFLFLKLKINYVTDILWYVTTAPIWCVHAPAKHSSQASHSSRDKHQQTNNGTSVD